MLTPKEAEGVVGIALLAALADGRTHGDEREQIRSLFESLARDEDMPSLSQLHQRVLLRQTDVAQEAAKLASAESRRMAFEMAVCIADAEGATTPAEQAFLDNLEKILGLDHQAAVEFEREAASIAVAPVTETIDPQTLLGPATQAAAATPAPAMAPVDPVAKDIDSLIMKHSILNGALELLPQNLATMAILPLQTRMVYSIGKRYGHSLDAGHIREFIATVGLGATSQMLENFARKALGSLVSKTLGKTAGKLAKAATGPMMSFASTYAIGQVAKAYYAGGRKISAVDLRSLFQRELAQGKALFMDRQGQIESEAQRIKPASVLQMVRGGLPA